RSSNPPRPSFAPPPNLQTSDAVPTCVVAGPDGAYYIGELSGIPFTDKRANIYRLDPATDAVPHTFTLDEAFLTGFKNIIDMAFGDDGTLYVLQHATGALQMTGLGVLIKVVPDKSQSDIRLQYQLGTRGTVIADLHEPTSVAIGPDDKLYVSIRGTTAGGGEVIRVPRPLSPAGGSSSGRYAELDRAVGDAVATILQRDVAARLAAVGGHVAEHALLHAREPVGEPQLPGHDVQAVQPVFDVIPRHQNPRLVP